MLHPFRTYQQLANETSNVGPWRLLARPLFVAFILGTFISFTVSAHLTLPLILDGLLFWSFIPILQALIIAGVVALFARGEMPVSKAIDLFFMGHGPLLLWLLFISASIMFFSIKQIYLWPTESGWIIPVSLLVVWLWSNLTSFAFLKSALNLTTTRAVASLLIYTFMVWGVIVSYLFAVETLQLHRLKP
jgi:hypothetical protein